MTSIGGTMRMPAGIGSTWRKWDLHVHTPDSIVHHYPRPDPWERFLEGLASLPPDISVIGINDYLFVDGFRRVQAEMESGRLPNLECIFPVIELRLDQFVGTEGHWNRVNLHVLFSEDLQADTIRGQFINGLSSQYQLVDGALDRPWFGLPDRQNLERLGAEIREATPIEKRAGLPTSDLVLGFNNLVVSLEKVLERIDSSALRGKAMLAVGKSEWDQMRWNVSSIASKKHVINSAQLSFIASENPAAFQTARDRLLAEGVQARLLDCSDAHYLADSEQKDRLGNCTTWINAEPSFEGLRHALTEYEHRVFVGREPAKRMHMRARPETFIDEVCIQKEQAAEFEPHEYFDVRIPINPGFVAIVGNKGKGKSALLDIIGHVGGSSN